MIQREKERQSRGVTDSDRDRVRNVGWRDGGEEWWRERHGVGMMVGETEEGGGGQK